MPQLACYNSKINWKTREVKMMRCPDECEKQWKTKQTKPEQQKQKEKEQQQKQKEKEQKKEKMQKEQKKKFRKPTVEEKMEIERRGWCKTTDI